MRDIAAEAMQVNAQISEGVQEELRLLRNLNENLKKQLKEANNALGMGNSFEKQNNVGTVFNKLEVRLDDLVCMMQDSLSSLEVAVNRSIYHAQLNRRPQLQKPVEPNQDELPYTHEQALFEAREEAV